MPKITVILNAAAGAGTVEARVREIRDSFAAHHLTPAIELVHPGMDIGRILERALRDDPEMVVAAGGDGTVSAVAQALAKSARKLGVLPLGTLNHFAKDLKIPSALSEAVSVIVRQRAQRVDLASVNGRFFVNNVSIGAYPKIVKHRQQLRQRGIDKWTALFQAVVRVFQKQPFFKFSIEYGGKRILARTPFIFVGNNPYILSGPEVGTRRSLISGKLGVAVAGSENKAGAFLTALGAVLGRSPEKLGFDLFETESVTVSTRRPFLEVAADGETLPLPMPLQFQIHPKSLTVIVP